MRSVVLKSRIPQINAELQVKMTAVAKEGAQAVEVGAKERVADAPPYGEGLISAIHTEDALGGASVVAGDSDHFYGHFVEMGTGGAHPTPAQPFLIPALESSAPVIIGAASRVLRGL
jgi:hypothetical protein